MTTTSQRPWQPGDPLTTRYGSVFTRPMFQVIDPENDDGDYPWTDAVSWPHDRWHDLGPGDELADFIREHQERP